MCIFSPNKNLADDDRREIYDSLLQKPNEGDLPKATIAVGAHEYEVSEKTISRILQLGQICGEDGAPTAKVLSRRRDIAGENIWIPNINNQLSNRRNIQKDRPSEF